MWRELWIKNRLVFARIFSYNTQVMSLTYRAKKRKRLRKHGFFKRMSTRAGKAILARRRNKQRKRITV